MIEKLFIKNQLTLKRYRKFKSNRVAAVSCWIMLLLGLFSFSAELIANSKPLYLNYNGRSYFPAIKTYHPSEFGQDDIFVTDYRALEKSFQASGAEVPKKRNWILWPVVKWDPFESNKEVSEYPSAPNSVNWMGTDDRGRDVLARLLYGFRYSIIYAFGVWLLAYSIGTTLGAFMGYMGGVTDIVGSRLVELIEMIPHLLLLITLISIFEPSMLLLVLISFLFDWTGIYHQMRAQFLLLRRRDFVEASRALGASHFRIIFKHILPNALTPLVTFSPFAIAANISGLALLDYLGLGLRAPTPSWGELMSQGQKYFSTADWLVWWPSVALLITMVALINIGLAIRDAYDSRI